MPIKWWVTCSLSTVLITLNNSEDYKTIRIFLKEMVQTSAKSNWKCNVRRGQTSFVTETKLIKLKEGNEIV